LTEVLPPMGDVLFEQVLFTVTEDVIDQVFQL
jgi:hypothetical protein